MWFSNVDTERATFRRLRECGAGVDHSGSVAADRQMGALSRLQYAFTFTVECKNARSLDRNGLTELDGAHVCDADSCVKAWRNRRIGTLNAVAERQQQSLVDVFSERLQQSADGRHADRRRIGARQQGKTELVWFQQCARADKTFGREYCIDQRNVIAFAVDSYGDGFGLHRDGGQLDRAIGDEASGGAGDGRFDELWKYVVSARRDRQQ